MPDVQESDNQPGDNEGTAQGAEVLLAEGLGTDATYKPRAEFLRDVSQRPTSRR